MNDDKCKEILKHIMIASRILDKEKIQSAESGDSFGELETEVRVYIKRALATCGRMMSKAVFAEVGAGLDGPEVQKKIHVADIVDTHWLGPDGSLHPRDGKMTTIPEAVLAQGLQNELPQWTRWQAVGCVVSVPVEDDENIWLGTMDTDALAEEVATSHNLVLEMMTKKS